MSECVTHHHACDCREQQFKDLEAALKARGEEIEKFKDALGQPVPKSEWQKMNEALDAAVKALEAAGSSPCVRYNKTINPTPCAPDTCYSCEANAALAHVQALRGT